MPAPDIEIEDIVRWEAERRTLHVYSAPGVLYPEIHVHLNKHDQADQWTRRVAQKLISFWGGVTGDLTRFAEDVRIATLEGDKSGIRWVCQKYVQVTWH